MSEIRLGMNVHQLQDKIVLERVLAGVADSNKRFPYHSESGVSTKLSLSEVYGKIAGNKHLATIAVNESVCVCQTPTAMAQILIQKRSHYTSLYLRIWSITDNDALTMRGEIIRTLGTETLLKDVVICGVRWAFTAREEGMQSIYVEEVIDDNFYDEAYPNIMKRWGNLDNFTKDYLTGDEMVLVLQGQPGTGKSRLIRKIMRDATKMNDTGRTRNDYDDDLGMEVRSLVLYTGDESTIKSDELFAKFMIGQEKILVIEDADYLLKPRAEGNRDLHRILEMSDGILKSVDKRIIMSTNIPNIRDIDEALVRPGRCFAQLQFNRLNYEEAQNLHYKLTGKQGVMTPTGNYSLADIYRKASEAK